MQVRSRSSAIKFGSNFAQGSPAHDMLFEDIIVHDSNRGLAIQARDGGEVYNIVFRRVWINGTRLSVGMYCPLLGGLCFYSHACVHFVHA